MSSKRSSRSSRAHRHWRRPPLGLPRIEARVEALLVEIERLKAGERMAMARAEAAEAREAVSLSTSTKAKEYKEKGLTLTSRRQGRRCWQWRSKG